MAESGRLDKPLTSRQEALVAALLEHPTVASAAAYASVPETTARRWLRDPRFVRAYRDARRRAVEHAGAVIQAATPAAVNALLRALQESSPPALQLRAAQLVLEHAAKAVELVDLVERVEQLEAMLAEQQQQQQQQAQAARGGMVRRVS